MKRRLVTLIGGLCLGATLPAFAGPDWQLIEQTRKAKAERLRQAQAQQEQQRKQSEAQDQMDQMMKSCMEMMKKS